VARDNIKQRDSLLAELVSLDPVRSLLEIVPPTIVGRGQWQNVPIMIAANNDGDAETDDQTGPNNPERGTIN
jgi:hypothetical protein